MYWQTFQLYRDIKTVVQLEKLMQHWTEVGLGSDWPSHGLTTSGINCQSMARLPNFSPGRRTVRHSSQVGKIKPTGGWSTQFMPIPHSNLKIGIGINWVKLAPTGFFLTEFNTINRCLHWLHQWCFTATPLI